MIKTDGGTFYLTAGEACYIFKIDGGALRHVHFGKRVEPEDDLTALGFGSDRALLDLFANEPMIESRLRSNSNTAARKSWQTSPRPIVPRRAAVKH